MRPKVLVAVLVASALAASGCFVEAWRSTSGDRHLVPFRSSYSVALPIEPRAFTLNNPSPPVRLDIPAVGLSAQIIPVGLNVQGQIQVPVPNLAGWYKLGSSAPGTVVPVVIVGHVDTYTGPAVFWRLTGIRTGEVVDLVRADGSQSHFVISAVTQMDKTAFPSNAVFRPTSGPEIRLITCTGDFDLNTRHYLDSLIAWGVAAT